MWFQVNTEFLLAFVLVCLVYDATCASEVTQSPTSTPGADVNKVASKDGVTPAPVLEESAPSGLETDIDDPKDNVLHDTRELLIEKSPLVKRSTADEEDGTNEPDIDDNADADADADDDDDDETFLLKRRRRSDDDDDEEDDCDDETDDCDEVDRINQLFSDSENKDIFGIKSPRLRREAGDVQSEDGDDNEDDDDDEDGEVDDDDDDDDDDGVDGIGLNKSTGMLLRRRRYVETNALNDNEIGDGDDDSEEDEDTDLIDSILDGFDLDQTANIYRRRRDATENDEDDDDDDDDEDDEDEDENKDGDADVKVEKLEDGEAEPFAALKNLSNPFTAKTILERVTRKADQALAYEVMDDSPDAGYGSWGQWSPCSATCDVGRSERSRTCLKPAHCRSGDAEIRVCLQGEECEKEK